VHDFAGVLSDTVKQDLQKQAKYLKENLDTEVAVVTISTLNGEDVFDYSLNLARQWGIGSKDNGIRGLLLLVVVNDRKTSIRTSRHLEGQLNDGITGEINREMGTYFKKGDFAGGLSVGLTKITNRLTETRNDTQPTIQTSNSSSWLWYLLFLPIGAGVIGVYLSRKRRRARAIAERRREAERNRANFFKSQPVAQPGKKKKNKWSKGSNRYSSTSQQSSSSAYESHSSSYDSSSSSSSYSSDTSSSSSSSDSGSSYSGGSDFGGGGSDSSW
jgi:uncharacterized membrane protein YgcG